jgi:hypothetical protein
MREFCSSYCEHAKPELSKVVIGPFASQSVINREIFALLDVSSDIDFCIYALVEPVKESSSNRIYDCR